MIVAQGIIKLYTTQNNQNYFFSSNNLFLQHDIFKTIKISSLVSFWADTCSYFYPNVIHVLRNTLILKTLYSDINYLPVLNFQYTLYICIYSFSKFVFKIWLGLKCYNSVYHGQVGRASCVLSNIKRPISVWHFHTYHEIGLYIQHPVNLKLCVFRIYLSHQS